jgi:uncharacterized protein (TIGR00299 family) protein
LTRTTFIDAQTAGISGDMLLGALLDTGVEVGAIQKILNLIPTHFTRCKSVKLNALEVKTHGFRSCRAELTIAEGHEESTAEELVRATADIADSGKLSNAATTFALKSMRLLTEVESQLHGTELSHTHLHEAGSADTLADILGTAAACDSLNLFDGDIYCSPVAVGGGTISFSHGTVSVPAPAVLEIARKHSIPIVGGPANEELATPTGMSMLANLVGKFVERTPRFVPTKVGYGAGRKELPNSPNLLRVAIGQTHTERFESDSVQIIETNLDDVSGEVVGSSIQRILDAGAKDVWITAAHFKKNRPGYTLHALCAPEDLEKISQVIIKETGTLGVRFQDWNRFILQREIVTVKVTVSGRTFDARVKIARDKSGKIIRMKPEFDDVEAISQSTARSLNEISGLVSEAGKKLGEKSADRAI